MQFRTTASHAVNWYWNRSCLLSSSEQGVGLAEKPIGRWIVEAQGTGCGTVRSGQRAERTAGRGCQQRPRQGETMIQVTAVQPPHAARLHGLQLCGCTAMDCRAMAASRGSWGIEGLCFELRLNKGYWTLHTMRGQPAQFSSDSSRVQHRKAYQKTWEAGRPREQKAWLQQTPCLLVLNRP